MELKTRQISAVQRADEGLRAFFGKVYNYMAGGLILSALTAYLTTKQPLFGLMYTLQNGVYGLSGLGWIAVIAPFVLIFMMGGAVNKANAQLAGALFWAFSALLGLSMGSIFLAYTGASIAQVFLVTAGAFLGLSIYGNSTKSDLSGWRSFLVMGLVGIIIAAIANIFLKLPQLHFVISAIGVFIFAGFTVYDTNRLKMMYEMAQTKEQQQSLAVMGALSLYLDFINLFQSLLYFLGDRR